MVDDEPATSADFFRALAERIGAPPPLSVPKWLARIVAGRLAVNLLCSPMITNSAKFKENFGWSPRYPSFRAGLDQVVLEWRRDPAHAFA